MKAGGTDDTAAGTDETTPAGVAETLPAEATTPRGPIDGAELLGDASLAAARIAVPGYTVGARLGAGGFGEVFRATHEVIGREVAIKVLHEKYSSDSEAIGRFIAEARAVGKMSHPGIVDLFEFGRLADGRHFAVMELLRGRTLRDVLRERGRLPLAEALPILRSMAEAIDAAHAAGIAHRDLKPDNVFVVDAERGVTKLIDFGLAKLTDEVAITQTGSVFGTPLYMSPEQCRGKGVDTRTDCYSFGALAYHVLTGSPPFTGSDALALALQHLNEPPEPPSKRVPELAGRVDRVLAAMLAKDPAARPMPIATAIEALADGELPKQPPRAWRLPLAVAVAVVSGGVAFALLRSPSADSLYRRTVLPIHATGGTDDRVRISRDGATIIYHDETATWAYDIASGKLRKVAPPETDTAPHGDDQLLLGDKRGVSLADRDGRYLRTITSEPIKELTSSHDGTKFAGYVGDWIVIHDLAANTTRRLIRTQDSDTPPVWSPDDSVLLWSAGASTTPRHRVRLTNTADGATRIVPAPLLSDGNSFTAAGFLPNGRIVYCADDARGISLRTRYPDDVTGATETVVAPIEPTASSCEISVAANGRVALAVMHARPTVATLDLGSPTPELRPVGGTSSRVLSAINNDVTHLYSYTRGGLAPGIYPFAPPGEPELHDQGVGGATDVPISSCPGEVGVVWQGRGLRHVELAAAGTETIVRLRTSSCAVASEWRVPAGTWSIPRCSEALCVIARDGAEVEVWRLDERARMLARISRSSVKFAPSFGFSPDHTKVIALDGRGGKAHLISVTDGTVRPFPIAMKLVQSVGWTSDPDHVIVAGMFYQEHLYAVLRVALDGKAGVAWASQNNWFGVIETSGRSKVIAGNVRLFRHELFLLEPTID